MNCGKSLELAPSSTTETRLFELKQSAPKGLQEKMRLSSTQIEGERKPVTILFTDIVGSTSIAEKLDPEEWREIVSGAHRRVGEAIYRYEGTIAQLLGDGVLAFFGAPITHEDDPIRAVRSAMDIQESIKAYSREVSGIVDDFQMRIGINTGTVVIGQIGTDLHMEYLAIGDAVNVAARLQSVADPGEIVLSKACARLVNAEFEMKDLGEVTVKGKEEPLQVFQIISAKVEPGTGRGNEGFPTPYVGRGREVDELHSALLSLCEGHGQIVTIMGEAGIGKTRLLEEVKSITCEDDTARETTPIPPSSIRWLEGRALSYGGSLSYWTITQLLLDDLGLSDGTPQVKIKVALRRRLYELFGDEKTDEIQSYLGHLLGLKGEFETEEHIQSMDAETLKKQILKSVNDFFSKVALERPTLIIFEDMHWADPSSLEALEGLLALTDRIPIMILMLMRIDRDHGSWGVKIKAETDFPHRYKALHLQRLTEIESSSLLEQLLGAKALPDKIRRTIMDRSEGNPFYLEEVVRHLIDQDLIVQDEEGWRVSEELEEIGIPDTLQGVLLARIDRLEEDVRRTLQMASVIGKSFLYRILETISEAEAQLDKNLSQLQRADLVREKARLPELEYIFKHTLTQEAAYNSLLHERRKVFHLKVGEALEELFPDRKDEFLGLLAYHFEMAEASEKAVDYLQQAGDKARLEEALKEALEYYTRAVELLTTSKQLEQADRTWHKIALVYQTDFQFQKAHHAYETAFAMEKEAQAQIKSLSQKEQLLDSSPHLLRCLISRIRFSHDPGKTHSVGDYQLCVALFAGLAELDSEMNIVPHVARSWEVLDGGRCYLFHLRDDVYWTDGTPVTASDFEWAWKRNLKLELEVSPVPGMLDMVEGARDLRLGRITDPDAIGVRALNPATLEVRLNAPIAYFMYLMAYPMTFPLPRWTIEQYGDDWCRPEHIVSNGPFRLTHFDERRVICKRNPGYFGRFPGNVTEFELVPFDSHKSGVQAYRDGDGDILWALQGEKILGDIPANQVYRIPKYLSVHLLSLNPVRPPLDDVCIRKALAQAIDRTQISQLDYSFMGSPATGGIIPIGMSGHSPNIGFDFNPSAAMLSLKEAGYSQGRKFPRLTLNYYESVTRMILEISRQWQDILGIEIDLEEIPYIEYARGNAAISGWVVDYPDPDSVLLSTPDYELFHRWGWNNQRYDDLVKEAACTPDRSLRMSMYRKADHILVAEDVVVIPLTYGGGGFSRALLKPWVKDFHRNALGYVDFKEIRIEHETHVG
jgi:ABC-type oligopeptide transport system substrate-binding subunit/class 3 adenylate cyclase